MSTVDSQLRVGMVGYAFMGAAHSQAWRTVNRVYDLPVRARMEVVCGRDAAGVAAAADRLGWAGHTTDWRELVARDDIDVVDICTPGDSHAEIAMAALAAGKHVLCEKPLANTVDEARAMVAAAGRARSAGVRSMCGYNYRRVPAVALMRELVAGGRIGDIRHVRAVYLQDWVVDPQFPLVWRLRRDKAGSGALGDIGAHIIDLTQYVSGQRVSGVAALTETFVKERPLPRRAQPEPVFGGGEHASSSSVRAQPEPVFGGGEHASSSSVRAQPEPVFGGGEHPQILPGAASGLAATGDGDGDGSGPATGQVTVDDAALFVARLDGGAVATYEASRFATGRKNGLRVELNGSLGSVAFDFERMNELEFYDATRPGAEQGFTRIMVTEPDHPYLSAWWPPGHLLGYEHTFTHEIRDFLAAIAGGTDPAPSFSDAAQVQLVLEAVERSAAAGRWTPVEPAVATRTAEKLAV